MHARPPTQNNTASLKVAKHLLAFIILIALWGLWLSYFADTEDESNHLVFAMTSHKLRDAVQLSHAEWLRKARADTIELSSGHQASLTTQVKMTKAGWPEIPGNSSEACHQLWQALLAKPAKLLTIQAKIQYKDGAQCHFKFGSQIIIYQQQTGIVDTISLEDKQE
ncbi:hypothetical protein [Catenovulum sediminis]|uniref:MSHA biogenesis protein MshF n=1 Tax=Catenovulum sediminis TaxID=1740262 RepID=A0ABV1RCP7_9ALTE|nr:hypothetical protein [Catenovulum sediminis]